MTEELLLALFVWVCEQWILYLSGNVFTLSLLLKIILPRYLIIFWLYVEKLSLSLFVASLDITTSPFLKIFYFLWYNVRHDDIPSYTFFVVFGVCSAPLMYDVIIHECWKIPDHSFFKYSLCVIISYFIEIQILCMLGLFDDLVASSVQSLSCVRLFMTPWLSS